MSELEEIVTFKSWLVENDGYFHLDAHFKAEASGYSIIAQKQIPADATIVRCPFSLVITPDIARNAIVEVLDQLEADLLHGWSERQIMCSYICLHWMFEESELPKALKHLPYLKTLPRSEKLLTPLHFTSVEIQAFRGTNLYGATLDREQAWKSEWKQCSDIFSSVDQRFSDQFTWIRYLMAASYISSRAFPSTLLSQTPSLVNLPTSYPVLIPGVDSLNHSQAHPVSWIISKSTPAPEELYVSLVIHAATVAGSELLNNYGPKPNSELILGYGFSLPYNPDDTIVLSVGGTETSKNAKKKWEVGRNARGVEGLWNHVFDAISQAPLIGDEAVDVKVKDFQDLVDASAMLSQMCQDYLDRLPHLEMLETLRPQVQTMLEHYVEGQRDILQSILKFAQAKEEETLERAQQEGVDLDFE